jgi:hypothetical protein
MQFHPADGEANQHRPNEDSRVEAKEQSSGGGDFACHRAPDRRNFPSAHGVSSRMTDVVPDSVTGGVR